MLFFTHTKQISKNLEFPIFNPTKAGLFEGSFSWGEEGGGGIFQEELI